MSSHSLQPQIVELPALTLVGVEGRFIGPMSPDANNHQVIPPLFGKFFARQAELPPTLDGFTYGACTCAPEEERKRPDELAYLVSASVAKDAPVPGGMKVWHVPPQTYALFRHRGLITRIGETMGYIFGKWLPQSEFESADGVSLERYDERFRDHDVKSEMDILVPVRKRRAG